MKKLLLLLLVSVNIEFTYSQEIINLHFDYQKKEFTSKTEKIKFKAGKTYQVIIYNVNTAIISSELKPDSYHLSSPTPEILIPFYQEIDEASDAITRDISESTSPKNPLDEIFIQAIKDYNNLRTLKIKSDSLYKSISDSLYKPGKIHQNNNSLKAYSAKNEVFKVFDVDTLPDLKRQVNITISYIEIANDIFKSKMKGISIDNDLVEKSAEMLYISNTIKSGNYLGYVNFIENALNPDTIIISEPFRAEKDIVELKITLIDSYKSDTLYNSSIPFYTRGNLSFGFSTGFFYNNSREDSYYLEERDASKNNILKNDNPSFDVSFGALGHLSYKLTSFTKLGVSMGVALSPLDGKTRYLIGGSILFGREKQVGINGGLVLAKLETLSNSVKNDAYGDYVPAATTYVPTYSTIKSGFYFGITYNLNLQKK